MEAMREKALKLWLTLNSADAEKLKYENPKVTDDLGYIVLGLHDAITDLAQISELSDLVLLERTMERIPKLADTLTLDEYEVLRIEMAVIIRPKGEATNG